MNPGGWYCFTCDSTPKEQLMAARRVEGMDYRVFCPTHTEWRSVNKFEATKRRKVQKTYAIFPGYIFIRMPRNHLAGFFRTKPETIFAVLSVDGEPHICDDDEIRTQAARHNQELAPAHYRYFQTGHELTVGETAIHEKLGIEVIVQEINGKRIKAVGQLLGKDTPVDVEAWELRKVG